MPFAALVLAFLMTVSCSGRASGESAAPPPASAPQWKLFGSWRARAESWNWFDSTTGDDSYGFTGSLLRIGAARTAPSNDITLELSAPALIDLPRGATAPPPQGQLGLGASYRDASGSRNFGLFLKQGFVRLKSVDSSVRLGRFEFIDGTETIPRNPAIGWLKRERIAHRLIGNFGWSHVQRSFDGLQFTRNHGSSNLTVFGGFPTRGVFDIRGMDSLTDVKTLYAAGTRTEENSDARIFGLYYDDERDSALKPDNRPLTTRQADRDAVRIVTLGGHLIRTFSCTGGTLDGLLWGAGQFGDWGTKDHRGFAAAAEIGWQPKDQNLRPWYRLGFYHASGDGDPADGTHGTYFPVLPTPRIYARFPFYSLTNLNDLFVQAILRPDTKTNVRMDAHRLTLADNSDGWYAGGGAYNNGPAFGYAVRPSGGSAGLATLFDLSIDYQLRPQTSIGVYLGHAIGDAVVQNIYQGRKATFGYVELNHRW